MNTRLRRLLTATLFALITPGVAAPETSLDPAYRADTIQFIADSWQGIDEVTSSARWNSGIRLWLHKLTNEELQSAVNAGSYDELTAILKQGESTSPTLSAPGSTLASTGKQYYPLNPCRILDTRIAIGIYAGPIDGRSEKGFHAKDATEITNQGGESGGCGVPTAATALVLNITATEQAGHGYLTAYPSGAIRPHASIINFSGNTIANSTILPICTPACTSDFKVYAYTRTHVVIDVMGYFDD